MKQTIDDEDIYKKLKYFNSMKLLVAEINDS